MDGPMWGLSIEENEKFHLKTLLTILRIPGVFLLDIWWTDASKDSVDDQSTSSLSLEDVSMGNLNFDSGLLLLIIFVLVNISSSHWPP